MKKILLILMLIVSFNAYSQSNFSSIIGTPVQIGNLLVAQFDFPQALTYSEAKRNCIDGWRLPSKDEHQNIICPNKSNIPNLSPTKEYWSGTEGQRYNIGNTVGFNVFTKLMYLDCDNGHYINITDNDNSKFMVRLVKSK
jgi:hypothetical protein